MRKYTNDVVQSQIKIQGKVYRLKTFTYKEAEKSNAIIRKNCEDNWGKTTGSLFPSAGSNDNVIDVLDEICGAVKEDSGFDSCKSEKITADVFGEDL